MHVLTAGSPRCGSCRALTCGKYTNKKRTHEHAFVREADGTITEFDPHATQSWALGFDGKGNVAGSFDDHIIKARGFIRSRHGKITVFDVAGALVAGKDVAVVPCFIDGSFRAWPKGKRLPRPRKVRLIIGPPRNYRTRSADKVDICAVAAELRDAVNQLRPTNGSR